jgi:hypothetical protein
MKTRTIWIVKGTVRAGVVRASSARTEMRARGAGVRSMRNVTRSVLVSLNANPRFEGCGKKAALSYIMGCLICG